MGNFHFSIWQIWETKNALIFWFQNSEKKSIFSVFLLNLEKPPFYRDSQELEKNLLILLVLLFTDHILQEFEKQTFKSDWQNFQRFTFFLVTKILRLNNRVSVFLYWLEV